MPEIDIIETCSFGVITSSRAVSLNPGCTLKSPWKTVKNIIPGHTSDQAKQTLWE